MKKHFEKIRQFDERTKKHHISEYAAQCAYYTVLSFIPFIILLLTVMQYTSIGKDIIFYAIEGLIPDTMNEFIEEIINEVYFKSLGTLSISIIFTLWSAGKGFFAICKGLHSVYEIRKKNTFMYFKMKSTLCTVVFIVSIIAVLILTVFGSSIMGKLIQSHTIINKLINFLFQIRNILLFLMLFLAFALMYKFVPNHKVKIKSQLIGAAFAASAWYLVSIGFSVFIKIAGSSLIYGSLTILMLLMIWVYFCMYFILIGAEINKMIMEKKP